MENDNENELLRLEGTVETLIFENQDTGYVVFELAGEGKMYVVCGSVGEVHIGQTVVCHGRFERHQTYGEQFHAETCEADIPHDEAAVFAFLSSGSLPYIGVATAKKLMKRFGASVLDVIANTPEQLTEIKGISAEKADRIHEEFRRMFGVRELIVWLSRFDISAPRAVEVYRVFGGRALEAVSQNPYLLCGDPLHITFRHADQIAQSLQLEENSVLRIRAALIYVLRHNANNGHTCIPENSLLKTTAAFISQAEDAVAAELENAIEDGEIVRLRLSETDFLFLPDLYAAEDEIAHRLKLMTQIHADVPRNFERNLQFMELKQGFAYADLQKNAVRKAMTEGCLVITGGPGTGKTTTINAIISLLESEGKRVDLCAPTGRAAKRMSELTGRKASTIHRLLEVDYSSGTVSFIHNDKNPLRSEVLILDEMSMVDVLLFQSLLAALRYSCRIIMVGDADQLPSVGAGNILGELCRSGAVPVIKLNEIFRQSHRSLIVENAHRIIEGSPIQKSEKTDDFFFLEAGGEYCRQLICELTASRLPKSFGFDPIRDIQVLCPSKLGLCGTQELNRQLQNLLNPLQGTEQLEAAGRLFRKGDKVMQVRNDYEIVWHRKGGEEGVGCYNGDIGIVQSINRKDRSMVVEMDDRMVMYPSDKLNELEIAYAVTIHKSQGSEFPAVIIPVSDVPEKLCYRNLIYTGITRARKLCIVVGRHAVFDKMTQNIRQNLRYSALSELLKRQ